MALATRAELIAKGSLPPDVPYATSLGDYLAQRLHRHHVDAAHRS